MYCAFSFMGTSRKQSGPRTSILDAFNQVIFQLLKKNNCKLVTNSVEIDKGEKKKLLMLLLHSYCNM